MAAKIRGEGYPAEVATIDMLKDQNFGELWGGMGSMMNFDGGVKGDW